jgi:hypothetical protein
MDRDIESRGDAGFGPGTTARQHQPGSGGIENVKDKALDIAADARDAATERLESRKNRAADTLSGVARSLRSSGEQLEGDQHGAGEYIRQAADQVERLAGYLQHRDVSDMLDQAEDFARRQPALFVGSAFALGLVGARFLKSSRERLDREEMRGQWDNRDLPEPMSDFETEGYDRMGTSTQGRPTFGATPEPQPFTPRSPSGVGYASPSSEPGVGYAAAPGEAGETDDARTTERPDRRPG